MTRTNYQRNNVDRLLELVFIPRSNLISYDCNNDVSFFCISYAIALSNCYVSLLEKFLANLSVSVSVRLPFSPLLISFFFPQFICLSCFFWVVKQLVLLSPVSFTPITDAFIFSSVLSFSRWHPSHVFISRT